MHSQLKNNIIFCPNVHYHHVMYIEQCFRHDKTNLQILQI